MTLKIRLYVYLAVLHALLAAVLIWHRDADKGQTVYAVSYDEKAWPGAGPDTRERDTIQARFRLFAGIVRGPDVFSDRYAWIGWLGGDMDRRELLALAGVAALTGSTAARAQESAAPLRASLIHVYATADGESHLKRVDISNDAGEIPVTGMTARAYARNPSSSAEWHTAPRRQFAINMTGSLEVEISDGSRHSIGQGDLVFLEDITGKGHVTRVQTQVTNLFIHVPQDWDMLGWARGGA